MSTSLLVLLIAFQIKHLIADYYLQFPYMYMNKGQKSGWVKPLFDHAGVHAIGTFLIVLWFMKPGPSNEEQITAFITVFSIVLFDFTTHFITDRIKAIQPEGPDTKKFWTNLGWDQLIHHSVGIIIVFYITYV